MGFRAVMGGNDYGKSDIRLVRVFRDRDYHELRDLRVDVFQEGDFAAAHESGDNAGLMATDTMRNTVYALAKDYLNGSIESFGVSLVEHFLEAAPRAERIRVEITEHPWERIPVSKEPHPHSFVRGAGERRAFVAGDAGDAGDAGGVNIGAGMEGVTVLRTSGSGWEDFHRDRFTTLPETDDRILSTVVDARWEYESGAGTNVGNVGDIDDVDDFDRLWDEVRDRILRAFTDHYSPSVQNTLYRMGAAVLEDFEAVRRVHLSLPNRHHILYDLSRFGLENDNEVFHADAEPYGLIEGWVERE